MTDQSAHENHEHETIEFEPLAPVFPMTRALVAAVMSLVPMFAFVANYYLWMDEYHHMALIAVIGSTILVGAVLIIVFQWMEAHRRRYSMMDGAIMHRHGLIWRKRTIVPHNRIQHVETYAGPIERLFNLKGIKIYTAGGVRADMVIEGLQARRAEWLREQLIREINQECIDSDLSADEMHA